MYNNRNLKSEGYAALIEVCKKFDRNANRDYATKKIQSLRGAFRKEYRKVQNSKINSMSPEDIYIPTLWYYSHLLFTIEQDLPSESLSYDFDCLSDDIENPEMYGNIKTESQSEDVTEVGIFALLLLHV